MSAFDDDLNQRLAVVREQGLYRELRRVDSPQTPRLQTGGRTLLNFASNDYLGLANHPALKAAAIRAVEHYGAGSGAARLICGSLAPHAELEEALAAFKGTAAALAFSTGYATALGTISALLGKNDVIILDRLVHASVVDAARLCGAKIRVFAHNDLSGLEAILKWARQRAATTKGKTLIVTESVFSMDGDTAPLREMVALKEQYGAWLMVDEAHATGLCGAHRRGLAEALGVSDRIEIQMGTLGKALGASGGYICGSRPLIDFLVNRARSFIFSTAPVPAASAAATAGILLVQAAEGKTRRDQLVQLIRQVGANVTSLKSFQSKKQSPLAATPAQDASAIIPLIVGAEAKAVAAAQQLRERNIFVPAIRYPTVARGAARLRVTLTAAHTQADVAELLGALKSLDAALPNLN